MVQPRCKSPSACDMLTFLLYFVSAYSCVTTLTDSHKQSGLLHLLGHFVSNILCLEVVRLYENIYCIHVCLLDKIRNFQVNKNAMLCISLDELFAKGMGEVNQSALKELMQKVTHTWQA